MENTEKEEGGVTIGGIFRTIGKRIWIVAAVTVALTLIAVIVFAMAINPMMTKSSMSFRIEYPTSDSAKYPDGSPFSYRDLISYEVLDAAKKSDDAFASLDVKDMLKEDDVTVSVNAAPDGSDAVYTLTVKNSRFKNTDTAERYIRTVAGVVASCIKGNAAELNFRIDRETFESASFSEKLSLLSAQKQTITESYRQWIEIYNASYFVNGKTLANHLADVTVIYGESTRTSFEKEIASKGFDELDLNGFDAEYDTEEERTRAAIQALIASLVEEQTFNQKIIDELRKDIAGGNSSAQTAGVRAVATAESRDAGDSNIIVVPNDLGLSEMLASYLKRNAEIDYQLGILQIEDSATGKLAVNVKPVNDFTEKVEKQFDSLNAAATTLSAVSAALYEKDTSVAFESQTMNVNGGVSIVIVAVGVLVAAFLVSCAVAYFVAKKKKPAAEAVREESENQE